MDILGLQELIHVVSKDHEVIRWNDTKNVKIAEGPGVDHPVTRLTGQSRSRPNIVLQAEKKSVKRLRKRKDTLLTAVVVVVVLVTAMKKN